MKTYKGLITKLESNEVFVFGSNLRGFHGAGAAGYASFGVPGNSWRKFNYDKKPHNWEGKWNRKGCSEGLQKGTDGWSYALPTVIYPGGKSIHIDIIKDKILRLYRTTEINPTFRFLIAYNNSKNLNGYATDEMAEMFAQEPIPENIVFEINFSKLVQYYLEK